MVWQRVREETQVGERDLFRSHRREPHGPHGATRQRQGQQELPRCGGDFSVTITQGGIATLTQHMEMRLSREAITFHVPVRGSWPLTLIRQELSDHPALGHSEVRGVFLQ